MAEFPKGIALKDIHCPECQEKLPQPKLDPQEGVVKAHCAKEDCSYSVDLMWIGAVKGGLN